MTKDTKLLLGFDFDETFAETNHHYDNGEERFYNILTEAGATAEQIEAMKADFIATQRLNIHHTGYGVPLHLKTYVNLVIKYTPDLVNAELLRKIDKCVEEVRDDEPKVYADVPEAVERIEALREKEKERGIEIEPVFITKGEFHHQRDKVKRVRKEIDNHWEFHILGEKTKGAYRQILAKHNVAPENFIMTGDTPRSDINPVLAIGGQAIYLKRPGALAWAFEKASLSPGALEASDLLEATDLIQKMAKGVKAPKPR